MNEDIKDILGVEEYRKFNLIYTDKDKIMEGMTLYGSPYTISSGKIFDRFRYEQKDLYKPIKEGYFRAENYYLPSGEDQ